MSQFRPPDRLGSIRSPTSLGAALLVGAIATFDVQLLCGAPHPRTTYRAAMPVAVIGLALQVVSGVVLLSADGPTGFLPCP